MRIQHFIVRDRGASSVEYALLITGVALVLVGLILYLGGQLDNAYVIFRIAIFGP